MYVASWVVFHLVNIIGVVVKLIEFFFSSNMTDQVHTINNSAHAAYFIYHLASFVILLSTISKCFRRNSRGLVSLYTTTHLGLSIIQKKLKKSNQKLFCSVVLASCCCCCYYSMFPLLFIFFSQLVVAVVVVYYYCCCCC